MANATGCLKYTLFGCLGFLAIVIIFVGGTALVALNRVDDRQIEDHVLKPGSIVSGPAPGGTATEIAPSGAGRLVLDFAHGGLYLHPAEPGAGLSVRARYDAEVYHLEERYENLPGADWIYEVRFRRTVSALHAIFRQLFGGGHEAEIHVYIPPELPVALDLDLEEGGCEAQWGGLWITAADIRCAKGGLSLDVNRPLREPMESLSVNTRMGGFEATGLGNTSPRTLTIDCAMGGADVELDGQWLQDCAVTLAVRMGGMDVRVPRDVEVRGLVEDHSLRRSDVEVQLPVLTFTISEKMGGIEVR